MRSSRKSGIQIAWKTVTYRSVFLMVVAVIAAIAIGTRLAFPEFTENTVKAATNLVTNLLERVAAPASSAKPGTTLQQAHITALDGTVRIKKASSNAWVHADYNVPLEKGDVIQTGSEGMAKIVFNDGTNYTVKQDSLIVIEENSANERQQTNVAVSVNTGTVDLATGTYTQGSRLKSKWTVQPHRSVPIARRESARILSPSMMKCWSPKDAAAPSATEKPLNLRRGKKLLTGNNRPILKRKRKSDRPPRFLRPT